MPSFQCQRYPCRPATGCIAKAHYQPRPSSNTFKNNRHNTTLHATNTAQKTSKITNRTSSAPRLTIGTPYHSQTYIQFIVNNLAQIYTLNFNRQAFSIKI
ncbi:MAG TPA: hypothetical protein VIK29_04135 [Paludibacter sp.]